MATNMRIAPVADDTVLNIQWSAIIAGAIGASALAFVLHTFRRGYWSVDFIDGADLARWLSGLYLVLMARGA